jgi:polysaccharide export outer membrane protein
MRFDIVTPLAVFVALGGALFAPCAQAQTQARPPVTDAQRRALLDSAQNRLGRPVSAQELTDAIKRSGLSETDLRKRLRDAGYDPSLVDSFVGSNASPQSASAASTQGFAQALQGLGLLTIGEPTVTTTPEADEERRPMTPDEPMRERSASRVFGKDVFYRGTSLFEASSVGPIDPSYRVGAGDQVQLVLTGDVEVAYELPIRRDGSIIVPQLGRIAVAGLTLESATTVVRQRAAAAYSGVGTGRTKVDLSVSRIRANVVTVIGDVEQPGAYQVNALASVFHAISRAGGPTERGSFRAIEVRRGGRLVATLDLYRYLLKGDAAEDVRMEQGDIIFVPMARRMVTLNGAVRRPSTYELTDDEGFADALRFAGGLRADAATERLQVDRILPPAERKPGRDRVYVDVRIDGNTEALRSVPLVDGDIVRAFAVSDARRNAVTLRGAVFRAGIFQLDSVATLGQLLTLAQGATPWGLLDRVKVVRRIEQTGQSEAYSLDVRSPEGRDFALREFDIIEVLDGRVAFPAFRVSVGGAVFRPGQFTFARNQLLKDMIDLAGGLREEASEITVSRRRIGSEYSDTTSFVYSFDVLRDWQNGNGRAAQFPLDRDDRIFVRSSPGYRQQRFVDVSGMFRLSGTYAINEAIDRVSTVVSRAGGLLPGAFSGSFRLLRAGRPVAIDLDKAIKGDREHDIQVLAGDRFYIGANPSTVLVAGEVERPSLVRFDERISFEEFVDQAGGVKPTGYLRAAYVEYPNGLIRRVKTRFWFFHSYPDVVSGSIVTVPEKPQRTGGNSERALQISAQITSLLASAAIAIVTLRR